jgi:nucleotide-binding universal stress UspA family protein
MSSRKSRLGVISMTAISGPVIVGVGDRPYADDAIALGTQLAALLDAPVEHMIVPGHAPAAVLRAAAAHDRAAMTVHGGLERELAHRPATVPCRAEARIGDPAVELANLSRDLDLLVCGPRGRGPLRAVLLGSVTERLLRSAACPVVIVPRTAGP